MHECMHLYSIKIFLFAMSGQPEHYGKHLPKTHDTWSISFLNGILEAVPNQNP